MYINKNFNRPILHPTLNRFKKKFTEKIGEFVLGFLTVRIIDVRISVALLCVHLLPVICIYIQCNK